MSRGGQQQSAGFTIVETLIVLAVTGGLFVAVAATLVGRQDAAEFTHAVQSVQSQVQQAIDQVSAGFYPNINNFTCTDAGGSVQIAAGTNTQGTNAQGLNQGCVFLGKVVQFGVQGTSPEQFRIYTVAGLLSATNGVTSPFQNANPHIVGVNYAGSDAGLFDYSTPGTLQYGLTTLWVRTGATNIGAVGFLMEPGSLNNSTGNYNSGAQQIDLVPISSTSLGQNLHIAANSINTSLNNPALAVNPSSGVQVCFVSGGTNQSAILTIGGSGRQLLVKVDVKSNRTCT